MEKGHDCGGDLRRHHADHCDADREGNGPRYCEDLDDADSAHSKDGYSRHKPENTISDIAAGTGLGYACQERCYSIEVRSIPPVEGIERNVNASSLLW